MDFYKIFHPAYEQRGLEVGTNSPSLWKTCFAKRDSCIDAKSQGLYCWLCYYVGQKTDVENASDSMQLTEIALKALAKALRKNMSTCHLSYFVHLSPQCCFESGSTNGKLSFQRNVW